jgi:hypothetical protein
LERGKGGEVRILEARNERGEARNERGEARSEKREARGENKKREARIRTKS